MPTRERSPNYPAHSLTNSIEFARSVYSKEKMGDAPAEVVATAMGHDSLNGAARAKIASMRQYGLLEGRADKLHLTDLAFRILHAPEANEVATAMGEAAYTPSLFAEIRSSKPDASDQAIDYWLRREKGFSADGAAKAVKAYRDTIAAVGLASPGYNTGDGIKHGEQETPRVGERGGGKPPPGEEDSGQGTHSVKGLLLEGGTIADLTFSGGPLTREGIDMLVDYLKLTRRAIPPTVAQLTPPAAAEETQMDRDAEPN